MSAGASVGDLIGPDSERGCPIRRKIRHLRIWPRDLIDRIRQVSLDTLAFYAFVPLAIGAALGGLAILVFPTILPILGVDVDTSDRVALATFFIEFAALPAIGLAAVEFWRAHQGPKLQILLTREGRYEPMQTIYLGEPRSHPEATFRLEMLLENTGSVAGRWIRVKVTATMLGGMQTAGVVALKEVGEPSVGKWERVSSVDLAFLGNDSFISYPGPEMARRRFLPKRVGADTIGRFELTCRSRDIQMPWDACTGLAHIYTTIWSDRAPRHDQDFVLLPGEDPTPRTPEFPL